jgi:hypothetical protein
MEFNASALEQLSRQSGRFGLQDTPKSKGLDSKIRPNLKGWTPKYAQI